MSPTSARLARLAALALAALVAVAVWSATTDAFPVNERQPWPSWHVYGWPVAFATSSRGRLDWQDFHRAACLFDLALGAVLIAAAWHMARSIARIFPRLTLRHGLALLAGASLAFAATSDPGAWLLFELLGATPPYPQMSATAGELRPLAQLPVSAWPVVIGLFALGYAAANLILALAARLLRFSRPELAKT